MAKEQILVVDDEEDLQELIRYNLSREGYSVTVKGSGEEALEEVARARPDMILLDLMLPGVDGFSVCRAIKNDPQTRPIPIVILTAKGEDTDIVTGLELGADDYMTKPFSPKVLIARIKSVLRRQHSHAEHHTDFIQIRSLAIDRKRHHVSVEDKPQEVTATEFALLLHLASHPGWVFTRSQLISAVKGDDYAVTERTIDVQIASLRKKLGPAGTEIETVHGVGYRFKE